jgi:hypothetical protein
MDKDAYIPRSLELKSTARIRQHFLDQISMPEFFFPDIPSSVLLIVKGSERPKVPEFVPTWAKDLIRASKKASVKLPLSNIVGPLSNWLIKTAVPCYQEKIQEIEAAHARDWAGFQQALATFFGTREDPTTSSISLKLYADLRVQQGLYAEAGVAYRRLASILEPCELLSQSCLCGAYSDILSHSISRDTLDLLERSRQYARKRVNHFTLCCLTEFYCRLRLNCSPAIALLPFVFFARSPFDAVINPFIIEQLSSVSPPRHRVLMLSFAATGYLRLGAFPLGCVCYRYALDEFHDQYWPFISQTLCHSLLSALARTGDDPIDVIVAIVTSRLLTNPPELRRVLLALKLDSPLPCRFVSARVGRVSAPGLPCERLRSFADWERTGERLFGAFYRGSFFDYGILRRREGVVGERISIGIVLKFAGAGFGLDSARLLSRGTAEVESEKISVPLAKVALTEIGMVPIREGRLEVYGVAFEWAGAASFEVVFAHAPIEIFVHRVAPKVEIAVTWPPEELVVGQIVRIGVRLRNVTQVRLARLSLFLESDIDASIVEPDVEEVCGQCRLRPVETGEELNVTDCDSQWSFPPRKVVDSGSLSFSPTGVRIHRRDTSQGKSSSS